MGEVEGGARPTRGVGVAVGLLVVVFTVAVAMVGTRAWAKPLPPVDVPPPVAAGSLWTQQFGGPSSAYPDQVVTDAVGNAYILGSSSQHMDQAPDGESGSVYLAKIAPDGHTAWLHQFGTFNTDTGCAIVADPAGNVTIIGAARVSGTPDHDTWIDRFDTDGNLESHATVDPEASGCGAAALDRHGNLYYIGAVSADIPPGAGVDPNPYAALLVRVDPTGALTWTRELSGTNSVFATGVAVDRRDRVYLTGYSDGVVDGAHDHLVGGTLGFRWAFVAVYDSNGTKQWVREFSNSAANEFAEAAGVTIDSDGNVAVVGRTTATLVGSPEVNNGGFDAFVVEFTARGKTRWIRQMNGPIGPLGAHGAYGLAIAAGADGDVILTGLVIEPTDGQPTFGDDQGFVAELDSSGTQVGYDQIGSLTTAPDGHATSEVVDGVTVDRFGNVTAVGWTWGTVIAGATNSAGADTFVRRYQAESTAAISDAKARTSAGVVHVAVTLDQPSPTVVAMQFATHDGSAVAGVDYQSTSGSVVFPAGATTASIPVTLTGAPGTTGRVKFTIELSNPLGVVLARDTAVATIIRAKH